MLVGEKTREDHYVLPPGGKVGKGWNKLMPTLEALPLRLYPKRDRVFYSVQWLPDRIAERVGRVAPDLVNLHWINEGFLRIETLARFNRPIVWTLHDSWPFTGGCHVPYDCDRYTASCGACPQLNSGTERDLSRWVWKRKSKAWKSLDLTVVVPSAWLAACARKSSLFHDRNIEVIPNGLDLDVYRPVDKTVARNLLRLPLGKRIILFGAVAATSDRNKGFHLLLPALHRLRDMGWQEKVEVVIFGAGEPKDPVDLGFKAHYLGRLNDDLLLALAYSAADLMTVPSLQESFGQTASEALSCGTPVLAFNATGLKDIVDHQVNGYLARPYEAEDLASGMGWILEDQDRHRSLCASARKKAEQHLAVQLQAGRYQNLYDRILESANWS
jgi:glycosyltransferase involved in cell wall biosynthesis